MHGVTSHQITPNVLGNQRPGTVFGEISDYFTGRNDIILEKLDSVKRKIDMPSVSSTHIVAEDSILSSINNIAQPTDFDSDDSVRDPNYEDDNGDISSDEIEEDEEQTTRKRRSNPKNWKKNIKKQKRHSGLEYSTKKNRLVDKKSLKPGCKDTCKLKCKNAINEEVRKRIHEQFWSHQKSLDMKRQFIASCVHQLPIKKTRERNNARQGKRKFTNKYVFEVLGKHITVCKLFFLNTLSISQQSVDTAINKKRDGGLISPDKRGKHVPINKISEEIRNSVRNHISQFPAYESHYSRERTKKRYLGNHLNLTKMYSLYLEDCTANNIPSYSVAKEWLYSEIFNYEYNFAFKPPENDTCDICDKFKIQLQETDTQENRLILQRQYDQHLEDSSNRYKLKAQDKERSKANSFEKVIMIDLEKCLPTPDLSNSQSFYSLKLWTFNLVIYDSTLQKSYCMMWDESVAGRGGNELASCLTKWSNICDISDTITELCIWSDNCPSQNRNAQMVMCYFWLLKIKPNINVINHKFLARGHTHLEADAVHSVIERERKKVPQFKVATPWDWQQLVRLCSTKKPFCVVGMETEDFLNFKNLCDGLTSPLVMRKKNESGEDFLISQVVHLQVRRESPGILFYKNNFNEEDFKQLDTNRKTRRTGAMPDRLEIIRDGPKTISTKKYNHLLKLLQWVPKPFHNFYRDLVHGDNAEDD